MPAILVATDADWVRDGVVAALADDGVSLSVVREGRYVTATVGASHFDVVILDLQVGNMGGMATCMALRLEESGGRLPHVAVVMLLDRIADVFLARRCGADAWLVKPIDPLRLQKTVTALLQGAGSAVTPSAVAPTAG